MPTFLTVESQIPIGTDARDLLPAIHTRGAVQTRVVHHTVVYLVFTVRAIVLLHTRAVVAVEVVDTRGTILTRVRLALINVNLTRIAPAACQPQQQQTTWHLQRI